MGTQASLQQECAYDAVIVGAGFAGLYALHRLRKLGMRVVVLERAPGVGGTWYWNRYPGARCDVESLEYSYKFDESLQQEWVWTERYAAQPEILRYLEHVADRFELRSDICLGTTVTRADFDETELLWNVQTDTGEKIATRFMVAATGCLSVANDPAYPGQSEFNGDIHYTSSWPHAGVDFTGKRVAVIGTGSSAIQSIPLIAEQASQLTVFQRTANFSVPAGNRPLSADEIAKVKAEYSRFRAHNLEQSFSFNLYTRPERSTDVTVEQREQEFERRWSQFGGLQFLGCFSDIILDDAANHAAANFIRRKISQIVQDPRKAQLLQPTDHAIGCKRLCSDSGYYESYNRPNVDLIDLRTQPISSIGKDGIHFGDEFREFDAIVYATGFDAMTGALLKMNITGRGGRTLQSEWKEGPSTYLGLMAAGFPNLFMITAPGSPAVLTNMVMSIEDHVDWIANCLHYLSVHQTSVIEPTIERQAAWMHHVSELASQTLLTGCNSWYLGANIPGKAQTFSLYVGFPEYRKKIATVAESNYDSFELTPAQTAACLATH